MRYSATEYARAFNLLVKESSPSGRRGTIRDFLSTVARQGALGLLPEIIREYSRLADKEAGVKEITIRTTERVPVTVLAKKLSFKARVEALRDVRLMGGAVVEVGDLRIDNSVANRLERARRAFIK